MKMQATASHVVQETPALRPHDSFAFDAGMGFAFTDKSSFEDRREREPSRFFRGESRTVTLRAGDAPERVLTGMF